MPDIIVEIKAPTTPPPLPGYGTSRRGLSQLLLDTRSYQQLSGRPAKGWLIVVHDNRVPNEIRRQLEDMAADVVADDIAVTAISREEIDDLEVPL